MPTIAPELVIPVSCVEQGRWQQVSAAFAASPRVQFSAGRAAKVASVSQCLAYEGKAVSDQGEVWGDITMKARRMGVASETGAMADLFEHAASQIEAYVRAFSPLPGQTGAIFGLAGKTVGLELFFSPYTLTKLLPKLARRYALDAMRSRGQPLRQRPWMGPQASSGKSRWPKFNNPWGRRWRNASPSGTGACRRRSSRQWPLATRRLPHLQERRGEAHGSEERYAACLPAFPFLSNGGIQRRVERQNQIRRNCGLPCHRCVACSPRLWLPANGRRRGSPTCGSGGGISLGAACCQLCAFSFRLLCFPVPSCPLSLFSSPHQFANPPIDQPPLDQSTNPQEAQSTNSTLRMLEVSFHPKEFLQTETGQSDSSHCRPWSVNEVRDAAASSQQETSAGSSELCPGFRKGKGSRMRRTWQREEDGLMATALELSRDGWTSYLDAARSRRTPPPLDLGEGGGRDALLARVREVAAVLRTRFGARRVVLFGSLAHAASRL